MCMFTPMLHNYADKADDRRSVSGVAVMLGRAVVNYSSRTEETVATYTSEAEYLALGDGVKDVRRYYRCGKKSHKIAECTKKLYNRCNGRRHIAYVSPTSKEQAVLAVASEVGARESRDYSLVGRSVASEHGMRGFADALLAATNGRSLGLPRPPGQCRTQWP